MKISLEIPSASAATVTDAVQICREIQAEMGFEHITFEVGGIVCRYHSMWARALVLKRITEKTYIKLASEQAPPQTD